MSNAKEFGAINKKLDEFTINFEILRDESWKSKTDIRNLILVSYK
ncbi:hypothetical protein [Virgibacillus necropolis]|nr:hypothetical protein [Virgibacillus necropolis]